MIFDAVFPPFRSSSAPLAPASSTPRSVTRRLLAGLPASHLYLDA